VQHSRRRRARRNPSLRMIKVTVHEKRRVNEEQPTPASSPSRNHDSAAPRQHPLICTDAELIHQVHGPPKPQATKSMLRNRIHISGIFPSFRENGHQTGPQNTLSPPSLLAHPWAQQLQPRPLRRGHHLSLRFGRRGIRPLHWSIVDSAELITKPMCWLPATRI